MSRREPEILLLRGRIATPVDLRLPVMLTTVRLFPRWPDDVDLVRVLKEASSSAYVSVLADGEVVMDGHPLEIGRLVDLPPNVLARRHAEVRLADGAGGAVRWGSALELSIQAVLLVNGSTGG